MGGAVTTLAEAIASPIRTVSSRVELVDALGNPVRDIAVDSATVSYKGEAAQMWGGSLTVSDRSLVPTGPDSPLDPRARLRVRLWWRIWTGGAWSEIPVGTMYPSDIDARAVPAGASMSIPLRDVLEEAQRGGYRGSTVQLGGMTVGAALRAIFERIMPDAVLEIAPSTVVLPSPYEVGGGDRSPQQDWTEIASLEPGWRVWSDRMGVVHGGPVPQPQTSIDWTEGPGCVVTDLGRDVTYSSMVNRVVCRSTSPEVNPPVVGVVEDSDPGSSTYVGRVVWQTDISSDAVTTVEAATNMARATYERYRRPLETVQITIPQRGDLDYRQPCSLASAAVGVAGDYLVSSWDLTLSREPRPMTVTMMQRSIQ